MSALIAHAFLKIEQSAWLLWSALGLALITQDESFLQRMSVIFLTGLIAAVFVFITGNLLPVVLLALSLWVLTFTCVWVSEQYSDYFLPAFIINFLLVVASCWPSTISANAERVICILLGTGIVLFWQILFWPYNKIAQSQRLIKQSLKQLQTLNRIIFSCLLQPDYASNLYRDERKLHQEKNKVMHTFALLRRWRGNTDNALSQLYVLYDIELGCAPLRWQESDHTLFAVCAPELIAILKEIDQAYIHLRKGKGEWHKGLLDIKIVEFEQHFHTVLNVTAREPIVFLIFIFYLKALSEAFTMQPSLKRG